MTAKTILKQALKLPKGQRLKIAEELLDSTYDKDVLIAGARAAEAAWQAYQRGEIGAKPAEEVIQRLLKRKPGKR